MCIMFYIHIILLLFVSCALYQLSVADDGQQHQLNTSFLDSFTCFRHLLATA
jgi:hypothetical protein